MEKRIIKIKDEKDVISALNSIGVSYSQACKLLRNKDVRVNGQRIKENISLSFGDEVTVFLNEAPQSPIDLLISKIKFEDENMIVLSKPS